MHIGVQNPEIVTNLTVTPSVLESVKGMHVANAGLGFNLPLNETDTGEYICKRVQIMNQNWQHYSPEFASLYIYVPGWFLKTRKAFSEKSL
jgi:hypothetical protein